MTEQDIIDLLHEQGPLLGSEILQRLNAEPLTLWKACRKSRRLDLEAVSTRYLRLDRSVEGYARLSPSIRREFQTYTLIGLREQRQAALERANALRRAIAGISGRKRELAQETVQTIMDSLADHDALAEQVCFVLGGDVVYNMAHAVPRPEQSTGQMVRGSDLDIVIIARDEAPQDRLDALDDAIYRQKHYLLVHPDYREELDYLIKRETKVREQQRFDTFEHMVACKIMDEGVLLWGSRALFDAMKAGLETHAVAAALRRMEQQAAADRRQAEARLLDQASNLSDAECRHLFYTREESEEIY